MGANSAGHSAADLRLLKGSRGSTLDSHQAAASATVCSMLAIIAAQALGYRLPFRRPPAFSIGPP